MSTDSPRVYLLDVEGTVAPIAFVYEQLFPYARAHFESFLEQNRSNAAVAADLTLLAQENRAEADPGAPGMAPVLSHKIDLVILSEASFSGVEGSAFRNAALAYLNWLMDRDRKSTALKSLQGKIWKAGFESGELKGTLFADVPDALRRWSADARVAIYSSGSVEAQQLVFRHSIFGDLTGLISAYFDTRTGPKQASASYAAIAAVMSVEPHEVLFLSDVVRELDAAREAGSRTRLVAREGNAPVEDANGHMVVESFVVL
ncbi:MAG: acireductone synthase [Terracidiphilus sp.]|jgi:enolase-phosphatase E1